MKRFVLVAVLVASFGLAGGHAKGQIGLYGQFSNTHDSSISAWYHGFTLGGYDNMAGGGPIHLGFDLRGSYGAGSQHSYRSILIGPRLDVKPPVLPIRPYLQAEIGLGGTEDNRPSAFKAHYNNKLAYGVIGGLDYTVLPRVDVRVPEIGFIRMSGITNPTIHLVSIGFGLVVRLP
jgi:opacity protein-like surface antigen